MTSRAGSSRRWTALALAALAAAWVAAPATVPVYDGPGQPDEPYRYVSPPAGAKPAKGSPTTATATFTITNGRATAAAYANSGEFGPQISVYVPAAALEPPPSVTSVTLTARPLAPQPPLPSDGQIVGNVYDISASGARLVGTGNNAASLQMRAPDAAQPYPVFEHLDGTRWQAVVTTRIGQDVFEAPLGDLGSWALVRRKAGTSSGGGVNVGLLLAGIALLVVTGVVVTIRMVRARGAAT